MASSAARQVAEHQTGGTKAAIDVERMARDVAAGIAGQESGRVGDVVDAAIALLRDEPVMVAGLGSIMAPIVARGAGPDRIFYVQSPLTRDMPPTPELWEAKELGGVAVHAIDDMVIMHNLPAASQQVLRWLS